MCLNPFSKDPPHLLQSCLTYVSWNVLVALAPNMLGYIFLFLAYFHLFARNVLAPVSALLSFLQRELLQGVNNYTIIAVGKFIGRLWCLNHCTKTIYLYPLRFSLRFFSILLIAERPWRQVLLIRNCGVSPLLILSTFRCLGFFCPTQIGAVGKLVLGRFFSLWFLTAVSSSRWHLPVLQFVCRPWIQGLSSWVAALGYASSNSAIFLLVTELLCRSRRLKFPSTWWWLMFQLLRL